MRASIFLWIGPPIAMIARLPYASPEPSTVENTQNWLLISVIVWFAGCLVGMILGLDVQLAKGADDEKRN